MSRPPEDNSAKLDRVVDAPDTSGLRGKILSASGWLISIALVLGLLYNAPLNLIFEALTHVNLIYFIPAATCIVLNIWIRGGRWALLLNSESNLKWRDASALVMIGLAVNAVVPGRIGDLARIGLAVARHRVGVVVSTSTVVIERMMDGLTLLLFLAGSLLILPNLTQSTSANFMGYSVDGSTMTNAMRGLGFVCAVLLVGCVLMTSRRFNSLLIRLLERTPGIGDVVKERIGRILNRINTLLSALRQPKTVASLGLYSLTIWLLMSVGNYFLTLGVPQVELSFVEILVLTSVTTAVSSIPSAPGAWGVFEAGCLFTLTMLGIPFENADGVAYMILLHLSQYLSVIGCGVLALAYERVSLEYLRRAAQIRGPQRAKNDSDSRP